MACSSITSSSACPSVCPQGLLFPCGLTFNSVQICPLSARPHLWTALPRLSGCEQSPVPRAERAQAEMWSTQEFQGSKRSHCSIYELLMHHAYIWCPNAVWFVNEKSGELPAVAHSLDTNPVLLVLKQLPMPQLSYSHSLDRNELGRGETVIEPGKVVMSPRDGFLRDPPAMSSWTSLAKAGLHMLPRLMEAG